MSYVLLFTVITFPVTVLRSAVSCVTSNHMAKPTWSQLRHKSHWIHCFWVPALPCGSLWDRHWQQRSVSLLASNIDHISFRQAAMLTLSVRMLSTGSLIAIFLPNIDGRTPQLLPSCCSEHWISTKENLKLPVKLLCRWVLTNVFYMLQKFLVRFWLEFKESKNERVRFAKLMLTSVKWLC